MDLDKLLDDLDDLYLKAQNKAAKAPNHPADTRTAADRYSYTYCNGYQDGVAAVRALIFKSMIPKKRLSK